MTAPGFIIARLANTQNTHSIENASGQLIACWPVRKKTIPIFMQNFLFISIGAVFGANLRYWLGELTAKSWVVGFPLGTLVINLSGSFILGFFLTLTTDRFLVDPRLRVLFSVGFLGAFTTFSTYAYESIMLLEKGQWQAGIFNLFGSAFLGSVAALAGVLLAKLF